MKVLIYDKYPVIREGLGYIVTKSFPNTAITYLMKYDNFIDQIISQEFHLVIADIALETVNFKNVFYKLQPFLSDENRIIFLVDDRYFHVINEYRSLSPYVFFLKKNASERNILNIISHCLSQQIN